MKATVLYIKAERPDSDFENLDNILDNPADGDNDMSVHIYYLVEIDGKNIILDRFINHPMILYSRDTKIVIQDTITGITPKDSLNYNRNVSPTIDIDDEEYKKLKKEINELFEAEKYNEIRNIYMKLYKSGNIDMYRKIVQICSELSADKQATEYYNMMRQEFIESKHITEDEVNRIDKLITIGAFNIPEQLPLFGSFSNYQIAGTKLAQEFGLEGHTLFKEIDLDLSQIRLNTRMDKLKEVKLQDYYNKRRKELKNYFSKKTTNNALKSLEIRTTLNISAEQHAVAQKLDEQMIECIVKGKYTLADYETFKENLADVIQGKAVFVSGRMKSGPHTPTIIQLSQNGLTPFKLESSSKLEEANYVAINEHTLRNIEYYDFNKSEYILDLNVNNKGKCINSKLDRTERLFPLKVVEIPDTSKTKKYIEDPTVIGFCTTRLYEYTRPDFFDTTTKYIVFKDENGTLSLKPAERFIDSREK